jgi:archaellum component FlaC
MRYSASYPSIAAVICLTICLAGATTQAQVVGQPYRLNDKEVERILTRIENQTKTFRKSLDSSLDRSRLNGTHREDDINSFMKAFEDQTKHLRDRFKDHKSVAADVQALLDRAAEIDGFMTRQRLSGRAEEEWSALRANLDELAQAYNVSWRWGEPVSASDRPLADRRVVEGPVVYPSGGGTLPYRLSDKEVEQILHRIERQSERFKSSLDSSLDRSRLNGTKREDDINAFVKDFNDEVKRLHDRFDDHKSVAADVQSVLDRAARIDEFMANRRLSRSKAGEEWARLRANLDELSQAYTVDWRWRY